MSDGLLRAKPSSSSAFAAHRVGAEGTRQGSPEAVLCQAEAVQGLDRSRGQRHGWRLQRSCDGTPAEGRTRVRPLPCREADEREAGRSAARDVSRADRQAAPPSSEGARGG